MAILCEPPTAYVYAALGMRLFAEILGKISLVGRCDMCDSLDVMLILFRQKWTTLEPCVFFRKKSTADCT